jgi:hypothetical protein
MTTDDVTAGGHGPLTRATDALQRRNLAAALDACAPGIVLHDVARAWDVRGHEALREVLDAWAAALPDWTIAASTLTETPDRGGVQLVVRGTHTGPFEDDWGPVPTSGKAVEIQAALVCTVRDGLLDQIYLYHDLATLLVAVGAL